MATGVLDDSCRLRRYRLHRASDENDRQGKDKASRYSPGGMIMAQDKITPYLEDAGLLPLEQTKEEMEDKRNKMRQKITKTESEEAPK